MGGTVRRAINLVAYPWAQTTTQTKRLQTTRPKWRIGRFLTVTLLAATSMIAVVIPQTTRVADMQNRYWLFNTDETETVGEGAYTEMLNRKVIAAWGDCKGSGAERTLNKPAEGDTVFYFLAGTGVIACGRVCGLAFLANSIFKQSDEFHRNVSELVNRLHDPVTVREIRENTGYHLPARGCIVCQLHDRDGAEYIASCFENVPALDDVST